MTTLEVEVRLSYFFRCRQNLMVTNVSWGMGLHECDILFMTQKRYLYEVEIKVSRSDLIRDAKKRHNHESEKIKGLYFAIPENLKDCSDRIPIRAGIVVVKEIDPSENYYIYSGCEIIRKPTLNRSAIPLTATEQYEFARLGALRIFTLKEKILKLKRGN